MKFEVRPILQAVHLSRVDNENRLIDDITLDIRRGEVLAIVGPSGAGKSSFLRLLNRLDEPTGGTVLLDGRDYREIPPRDLRRRVGMVMQSPFLFPGTVVDNLTFGPRQRGEEMTPKAVEELLDHVRLSGYGGRNVGQLSGGEAQRVALARILANTPEVLLLDEPTSALDDATKNEVEGLIVSIMRDRGHTCLIVTHEAAQAARLANRVVVMEKGRLVRIDNM
jgi:putative ABC transport system ATP-binding protein